MKDKLIRLYKSLRELNIKPSSVTVELTDDEWREIYQEIGMHLTQTMEWEFIHEGKAIYFGINIKHKEHNSRE